MILGTIRKTLPYLTKTLPIRSLTLLPRVLFSRAEKFESFKAVLQNQIKQESGNAPDVASIEQMFILQGWKMKKQRILVELSQRIDDYDVRMLSTIKPPTFQQDQEDIEMSEVTVCVTRLGSFRTMAVHVIVADGYEIARVTFHPSFEQIKEHRQSLYKSDQYNGPYIETLPQDLFEGVSQFLAELGVNERVLKDLAEYCKESEHSFYVGWLQDLKNVL